MRNAAASQCWRLSPGTGFTLVRRRSRKGRRIALGDGESLFQCRSRQVVVVVVFVHGDDGLGHAGAVR